MDVMEWLAALDLAAFRCINQLWSNALLDVVLPVFSGNWLVLPSAILSGIALLIFGGAKARWYITSLVLALLLGDQLVVGPLKKTVARTRPYAAVSETRLLVGRGNEHGSFPSSHSANAACLAAVTTLFYRRSLRYVAPTAGLVGLSRVYVGAHYPFDVLGGWTLGAAYGIAVVLALERSWQWMGRGFFPLWWSLCPSIRGRPTEVGSGSLPDVSEGQHWVRAGYILLGILFIFRCIYLGFGILELSEDEAYQWLWSKHLAWSYYSKPPAIAVAQWIGTHLFGDTELGVRFLSPVLATMIGVMVLRFLARTASGRTAFLFLLVVLATPLLSVGSILITIDPLLVACWMWSLFAGWQAWTRDSKRWWLVTGLAWGGAFLCKFASPFLWASWLCFFWAHAPARRQVRRPGIWLALAVNGACMIPVLYWNAVHGWPTLHHLQDRSGLGEKWHLKPDFFFDFMLVVPLLLNPFFFASIGHASLISLRDRLKNGSSDSSIGNPPISTYLWCFGGPLFLFYLGYTIRARVQPNWIAASVLPLLLFATLFWHRRWQAGDFRVRFYLIAGLVLGLPALVLLHETNLVARIAGRPLPARYEPLKRVRGYRELARIVGEQRAQLERQSGRTTFVIADHYGRAGLLSFYLPEARATVGTDFPLVVVRSSDAPENQFWFWPEYRYAGRHGDNAVYVMEAESEQPVPGRLMGEFRQVENLGLFDIVVRSRRFHRVQMFACRELR